MAIDDNTSYELTGYQVKDLASKIRAKADSNSLASVATSGLYSDLTGAPTIPTVYNGTLTIQQNGTTLGTFSANQDTNETINITGGGGVITTLYWDGQSLYKDALFQTLATGQDVDDAFTNGVLKISDGSAKTYLGTGYNVTSFIAITSADSYNGIHLVLFEDNTTSWDSTRVRFHDFFGATSSTAGTHGFVPAPAAGDQNKVLKGDGTWVSQGEEFIGEFTTGSSFTLPAGYKIYHIRGFAQYSGAASNAGMWMTRTNRTGTGWLRRINGSAGGVQWGEWSYTDGHFILLGASDALTINGGKVMVDLTITVTNSTLWMTSGNFSHSGSQDSGVVFSETTTSDASADTTLQFASTGRTFQAMDIIVTGIKQ